MATGKNYSYGKNSKTKKKSRKAELEEKEKFGLAQKLAIGALVTLLLFPLTLIGKTDTTPYGYEKLTPEVINYLSTSPHYSQAYHSGKMVVLYMHKDDKYNDYFGYFKNAVEKMPRMRELDALYKFETLYLIPQKQPSNNPHYKEIIKNEKALRKQCRRFCIVSPAINELYFYYQPRQVDLTKSNNQEQTDVLKEKLLMLKYWGIELHPKEDPKNAKKKRR
ncbi:hypothetical protein IKU74_08800 [bacterium]|nr:hypothetical protein [bacterium]